MVCPCRHLVGGLLQEAQWSHLLGTPSALKEDWNDFFLTTNGTEDVVMYAQKYSFCAVMFSIG